MEEKFSPLKGARPARVQASGATNVRAENAGVDGKYFWSQSLGEVYVRIPVPGTMRGTDAGV